MAITTSSVLPPPVQTSFDMKILSTKVPKMIYNILAVKKSLERNSGNTLRQRRYNPLKTAMAPLGNSGVHPQAQLLTSLDIDAKIKFYGSFVQINEQVTLQNQDPKKNGVYKLLLIALEAEVALS